ncbi:MAG: hypothetical protein J5935_01370 [Lachnospiraceae bacterium]|nr:hypothetical protein [Lachnospiraceae bacterium]
MKKRFLALFTAVVLAALTVVPVFAEKYDANDPIVEATGTTTNFDKYLVMDKDAQVPYADFLFEVTSDGATGNPASDAANEEIYPVALIQPTSGSADVTPVVWKGVRPDKVVVTPVAVEDPAVAANIGELVFQPTDTTTAGPYRTGKADIATANEKYVKKQITLDFSAIKFAEPGVYRYYVQEKNGTTYSDLGITYDVNANNSTWRTLDVYVTDNGEGNLAVSGYVWYETKRATTVAPDHTADAADENAWGVEWTDASNTNKKYVYVSNNTWKVQTTEDGGTTWTDSGETIAEPPAASTGSVTIDGTPYTTWAAAKAAMKGFTSKELTPNGAEAGDKSSEFVNDYGTQDLEFGKKVEGNQGSRDQWFKFKVTLTNADLEKGTKFEVNVGAYTSTNPANAAHFFDPTKNAATSYDATDMKNANTKAAYATDKGDLADVTEAFTAAKNGTTSTNYLVVETKETLEWELYLQHGQYVQIKGIPNGVTYTVQETDPATGYTKTNGTDVAVGVIDNEEITNAHKDPLTGEVGNKSTKTYVKDAAGDKYKDGDTYKQLYINPADNKPYKEDTYTTEWTGDRYSEDEDIYTGVTNKRDGVIPTGVLVSIGGGALMVILAAAYFLLRGRREDY